MIIIGQFIGLVSKSHIVLHFSLYWFLDAKEIDIDLHKEIFTKNLKLGKKMQLSLNCHQRFEKTGWSLGSSGVIFCLYQYGPAYLTWSTADPGGWTSSKVLKSFPAKMSNSRSWPLAKPTRSLDGLSVMLSARSNACWQNKMA